MMRQTIWTGTCAAIVTVATTALFAQTPAQPPTPQSTTPPASADKITVTGCLKAAPPMPGDAASPAGTTGTTAADPATAATTPPPAGATGTTGAANAKFILTGASATPADTNTAQTYRLIANPTALSEHVGKKLELVGTIDKTSTPDPKDPAAAAPAFRVESGKIVAATCNE
ncbi:MAG TPA: hypothetical protein VFI56_04215 [Vicinamibacterales bacterium]|nr:hypothetical protein [Vicinamibacterales bacterium]